MSVWDKITPVLKEKIGEKNFDIWFSSTKISVSPEKITIEVPNSLYKEWISSNYKELLEGIFLKEFKVPIEVDFKINSSILKKEIREKNLYSQDKIVISTKN